MLPTQLEWIYLGRLALAALFGVIVGSEREAREKAAGVRTQALVCMGATAFALVSAHVDRGVDPTRVAAQVASGVGFLGAGAIIVHRERVMGLTTAATIWLMAAVGLLVGFGEYILASGAVLLALVVMEALGFAVISHLTPHKRRVVRVIAVPTANMVETVENAVVAAGYEVPEIRTQRDNHERETILMEIDGKASMSILVDKLRLLAGVKAVELTDRQDL
jgi:putative Mg2+ transporter-C (MgtC) family protein